jgi:pyruvate/2-oxoglutarate dehydrogenase complex dihydrolipoamide dehydrogenase (E3) component
MIYDYDFLIIGGGSAGYAAARTAASLGLRTCVVDGAPELGGLCILRGCMPSKTLLASSSRFASMRRAEEFGLRASGLEFRGDEIIARKRRLISGFADYRAGQLKDGRFHLLRGHASFLDAHTVEVTFADEAPRRITAHTFLIATGSKVGPVPIPELNEVGFWTTDDVLESADIPASVIILGGGATAVEFATYYSGLGRDVTIIQRSEQILKGSDEDVAHALAEGLRQRGIKLYTGTKLLSADRTAGGKRVSFTHGDGIKTVEAAQIIHTLGRIPNVAGLTLSAAGVKGDKRPHVADTQQTSVPHIFAAGDVAGPYEIVHIAIQQGEIAARNARRVIDGEAGLEKTDYRLRLYGIFSDPEVAFVGASEHELYEKGVAFRSAKYPFDDHGKSLCMGEADGFVKLIASVETGEILGGAVVGPHATELIHEVAVAMHFRSTAAQFAAIPHYHPTLSEIWTYPAEELAEQK